MVKKKKLCIITPVHWSFGMGGAEYQMKLLANNFSEDKNFHVTYVARKTGNGYRPSKYDLIKISKENIFQQDGSFVDVFGLLNLLEKIKPDIIYQTVGCAYTGIAAFYAKKAGCAMIWHIASDNDLAFQYKWSDLKPNKFIDKKLLQWGIKNTKTIIAQSECQKKIVEKINPRASIHLIRNFHPLPEENEKADKLDQIVWVANIKTLKQPEMYIELAAELKRKAIKTKCIMIGKPAVYPLGYQNFIVKLIEKMDNLNFLGPLPQEKVNEIICKSKLLINTSKWEGFPNTFIQAWMRKTPVVSLHCDPDHIIRNYECGMVSGTLKKMVEDVAYLLNNEDKRLFMGENAQRYAFENHSMKNLKRLEKIISGNV